MRCEEVQAMLPALMKDGQISLAARRHVSTCRACQAELRRYEGLAGALGNLTAKVHEPPVGLRQALIALPEQVGLVRNALGHVVRNRAAYAGGAAVALAGAIGTAVWINRRRLATG
jgi:hypothetical protein